MDEIDSIGSSRLEGGSGGKTIDYESLPSSETHTQSEHDTDQGQLFGIFLVSWIFVIFILALYQLEKQIYQFLEI